jgi:Skp family chaperone for outer membrane proteins
LACLLLAWPVLGQVTLKRGAVVYHGSASNTTAPATIEETTVRDATPEWRKIQAEGIDPESAHGRQLLSQMHTRIRAAVRAVAVAEGRDLVVNRVDLLDARGREVVDLTRQVVAQL